MFYSNKAEHSSKHALLPHRPKDFSLHISHVGYLTKIILPCIVAACPTAHADCEGAPKCSADARDDQQSEDSEQ